MELEYVQALMEFPPLVAALGGSISLVVVRIHPPARTESPESIPDVIIVGPMGSLMGRILSSPD